MDEMTVNVQQDCAIELLINNMGLEDLVVEGLGCLFRSRHCRGCDVYSLPERGGLWV